MPNAKEIEVIMMAAEKGNAEAQKNLGKCYYAGDGVEQSYEKAVEWYTKAAEQGNASAQNKLGVCYYYGYGIVQDYEIAAKWCLMSAEQGYVKAQSNMGFYYLNGEGVLQNNEKAVEWFRKAAEQGNDISQLKMGDCFANGEGVVKSDDKAAEWYAKAAEQGNARAQYKLGHFYSSGRGVAKDEKKAFELLLLSANQGCSDSQLDVGYRFEYGMGVRKNLQKAVDWYEKSATQGNPIAQTNLGYCYEKGIGTAKDYERAAEWYAKAVEQDNARAMNNLGLLYEQGFGVIKNFVRAFELYSRSAQQGYVLAFANMGYCYENGIGVSRSYKDAEKWYSKAAAKGNKNSKNALKRVKDILEAEEWMKGLDFSTRQKVKKNYYSRVIPFGKNYIVKRKGLWGIVDKEENILLPIEYTRVHWFDGGYAGIQTNKKWGLVNRDGVIVIEPQYDILHYLSQHNACDVEREDDRFIVDTNNNPLLRISGKRVRFQGEKLVVFDKDGSQLYNFDGTPFSKVHSYFINVDDRYIGYDEDRQKTVIKANGEEVVLPKYEIGVFRDHIAQFRFQNKYGVIDENANIVVPNQYDYITLGSGVIAINEGNISKDNDRNFLAQPWDGEWYFWNYKFKEITPYRYKRIGHVYMNDGEDELWFAERDDRWYKITPEGEFSFANNETDYKKKKAALERSRNSKVDGKFGIFEDPTYKKDGRKLFVRACDGKFIRHFYLTPYLPMHVDGLKAHWKIGESHVNIYGQDMPNPHAFKMPKQKKKRYVFKLNSSILKLEEKQIIGLFVNLLKLSGFEKKEILDLYAIFQTKKKRAVVCDWLIRKYKRNKSVKYEFDDIARLAFEIEEWLKKHE